MIEQNAEDIALSTPSVESIPAEQYIEKEITSELNEECSAENSTFLTEDTYEANFAEEEPVVLESTDIQSKASKDEYDEIISIRDDFIDETKSYSYSFQKKSIDVSGSSSQKSETEGVKSKETSEQSIDRKMYYTMHAMYSNQLHDLKKKNSVLQNRMTEYYLRRKMFQSLHAEEKSDEHKRYYKILETLDMTSEAFSREQNDLEEETALLNRKCVVKNDEVKGIFLKLLTQEAEFTKVLSSAADEKTKAAIEKFVERHIKRQQQSMDRLSQMRLVYIKIRNKYTETKEKLDALENLGSHLRLIDYEELKEKNKFLKEKLEEKDFFLTTIRKQCQHLMQVLAHNREKLVAISLNIGEFNERLEMVTDDYMEAREQISALKFEKDELRNEISKIKEHKGLLARPKLLRDMETTLKEIEEGKILLAKYKEDFKNATYFLQRFREQNITTEILGLVDKYKAQGMKRRESRKRSGVIKNLRA